MKNTFGNAVSVTLFGESHGPEIGAVLDGLAPGIPVSEEQIALQLKRRSTKCACSTARKEADAFRILSGVYQGKTTGTPICITIANHDTDAASYESVRTLPRPGHADYTAECKYHGFQDPRGGGHFSGRLTAPLVAAGAIALSALAAKGIRIGTHVSRCAAIPDRAFRDSALAEDVSGLSEKDFPVLDDAQGEKMKQAILAAASQGDSVGGILETAVLGVPAGVGEPWFDTAESVLAHILFSIPAVKGVEFGIGFGGSDLRGSQYNDAFYLDQNAVKTRTNRNGGINGGITNGMPVLFRTAIKPTPSVSVPQETVDLARRENAQLCTQGRHDPAILHRACAVTDSAAALAFCDLLTVRYGTDYLRGDAL